jgi:hypothetical protein
MPKLTLTDLTSLTNESTAISQINANGGLIEVALENTLSRDGTTPNTMTSDIDLNGNDLLNIGTIGLSGGNTIEASLASAEAAATAAAVSESAAATSYDNFDDRYLGQKSSDPSVDNDGSALLTGAMYFNTSNNVMMAYTGSAWVRTTPTSSDQTAINTVNANATNINTVAGVSANVTTVAGIASNVTSVAGNATNINKVATVDANVTKVADIDSDVTTVANIDSDVAAVENIAANVTTVAGVAANITTVAGVSANVTTVAGISANTTTVAGIAANVTTTAGISSDVTTVAGISGEVSAVAAQVVGYDFSTTTTMADPGSGNVRFNHATIASVSAIAIDDLDKNSVDQSAFIVLWDDSTNTVKGTLVFRTAGGDVATFNITGLTDNVGWSQIAVTHVASSGTFGDGEDTYIGFTRAGDKGSDGIGAGDVIGPGSATDNAVARFDSTTGKLIQNSVVTVSDAGAVAGVTTLNGVTAATAQYTSAEETKLSGIEASADVTDSTNVLAGLVGQEAVATGFTGTLDGVLGGGTPAAASITTLTLTNDLTVANGGTGASTFTANNVLLGNGTSAFQVIAPGSDGQVLTSTGSTWQSEAVSGGGKVLQIVQGYVTTEASTTSTSYVVTGLDVDITPASSSNKILVMTNAQMGQNGPQNAVAMYRDTTNITDNSRSMNCGAHVTGDISGATWNTSLVILDSPSTTSAITYSLRYKTGSATAYFNRTHGHSERGGYATITAIEIDGT